MKHISKIEYDYLHYIFTHRTEQSLELFNDEIEKRYKFDDQLRNIVDQHFDSLASNGAEFIKLNILWKTLVSANIKIITANTAINLLSNEILIDSEINHFISESFDIRNIFDASDVHFMINDRAYTYITEMIPYDQYISKLNDIRDLIEPI